MAALEALREANGDSLQGICKCFPPQGREKTFQAVVGNSAEFFSCRFSKRRAFPVLLCGRRNDGRTGQEGKRRLMCYCLLPRLLCVPAVGLNVGALSQERGLGPLALKPEPKLPVKVLPG